MACKELGWEKLVAFFQVFFCCCDYPAVRVQFLQFGEFVSDGLTVVVALVTVNQ